jgi:hypothetical protein
MLHKLRKFLRDLLAFFAYVLKFLLGRTKTIDQHCVCPPALKRPDPFIYSQTYLTSLGLPITWDNPDISIFFGSTLVDPHNLTASTPYTVVARIWNNSTDAPALDMQVTFSYLSFGMGTQSNPIGTVSADVNAKGLPGCPSFASITWTTPATLGHYCLQVLLEPVDDLNWQNNMGQRNTDVTQPASPASFTFSVGNHAQPWPRIVRFSVDTYAIPPLRKCSDAGDPAQRLVRTAPPVPPGWTVAFTPAELRLARGEEADVAAAITPPPGFHGRMPFNVTGHDNNGVVGGVTLTVEVP